MTRIQRLMRLHRLMDAAGEHGSDGGGAGTGGDGQGEGSGEGAEGQGEGDGQGDPKGGEGEGNKGATKPSDAEAKLLKEVMDKKRALETANTQLAQVNERLAQFEGIDAAKVRELLKEKEEQERTQAEARGDYEKLKKQMADSHAAEKTTLQSTIEAAQASISGLQKQIADLTVGGAFSASTFIAEDLTLPVSKARALYGSHFEFKDGVVVAYDKPASSADRAPLVDAAGTPLSFDDAFRKIVDADPDKDQLYRSKVKPGAGSTTTKTTKAQRVERDDNVTGTDRIALGLKNLAKQTGGK
ncbi:hypothetical protein GFK26_18485 [Variovorax paradoxus]|uniref:DUF6651 domain-containing protein n=1 Tax=Variovorax paradoxus TaxID=34073 RepID=A0A5Q0M7X5_VARPD|nr:DUF6651 domain-containing protein [Variovorax paradoxus]QFZ84615.1 hypothetical protein GFK26_18485 [Variovorax paradoxus]